MSKTTPRSSACSTRATWSWSGRRTAPTIGRGACGTIFGASALRAVSFRSIRTASEIWGTPCFPDARGAARAARPSRHLHAGRDRARKCCARARPPARAAPRSMRRASARAATSTGFASPRSCATCSPRPGSPSSGPTAWGSRAAHPASATIPDETLQELAPSPIAVVAQSGAHMRLDQPRHQRARPEDRAISPPAAARSAARSAISSTTSPMQPELRVILCYIEAIPDADAFPRRGAGARARTARPSSRSRSAARRAPAPSRSRIPARSPGPPRCSRPLRRRPASCASSRSKTRSRRWNSWRAARCRAAAISR